MTLARDLQLLATTKLHFICIFPGTSDMRQPTYLSTPAKFLNGGIEHADIRAGRCVPRSGAMKHNRSEARRLERVTSQVSSNLTTPAAGQTIVKLDTSPSSLLRSCRSQSACALPCAKLSWLPNPSNVTAGSSTLS